jgi:hypothetical protein
LATEAKRFESGVTPKAQVMETSQLRTSGIEESGMGMQCHLCGATQDANGRKFINPSRLLEHLRKAHPEAVSTPRLSPPPIDPSQAYSVPKSMPLRAAHPAPRPVQAKFCPHCGFHLEATHAAMKHPPAARPEDA